MSIEIIKGGGEISHSFLLLNGKESAIVDCGNSSMSRRILERIEENNIENCDVKWVILSHTHYDHVKGVKSLLDKLGSSAKIVVHEEEYQNLIKGELQFPKPTSQFRGNLKFLKRDPDLYFKVNKFDPKTLIKMEGKKMKLGEKINLLWTPGHSRGSICTIFGDAIIMGDIIECYDGKHCFPTFCDDMKEMFKSWKMLIDTFSGEDLVLLPSHGIGTSLDCLSNEYDRYIGTV